MQSAPRLKLVADKLHSPWRLFSISSFFLIHNFLLLIAIASVCFIVNSSRACAYLFPSQVKYRAENMTYFFTSFNERLIVKSDGNYQSNDIDLFTVRLRRRVCSFRCLSLHAIKNISNKPTTKKLLILVKFCCINHVGDNGTQQRPTVSR